MEKDYSDNERFYKGSLDKDLDNEKFNKRYSAYSGKLYFTVFRVGDKFKAKDITFTTTNIKNTITVEGLKGFEYHNNRKGQLDNVDSSRTKLNQVLVAKEVTLTGQYNVDIGNVDVTNIVKEHLKGVKLRDNSVIARELVLSAGNGFYERMTPLQRETWLKANMDFLKNNFGDNCVYATLHMDETTPHIHALIVPKFWDEKRKLYVLRNSTYFDGKDKMKYWQDEYTNYMTKDLGNVFMRGIRGSKAKHIDLKTYYALINENLNVAEAESIKAYAKENYLNRKKVQELQDTLKSNEQLVESCNKIIENNKKLKESSKIYERTIKTLAAKYKIPEKEVLRILNEKSEKDKKQRER